MKIWRSLYPAAWAACLLGGLHGCALLRHSGEEAGVYQLELDSESGGRARADSDGRRGCGLLLVSSPLSAPGTSTANMLYTREQGRLDYYANSRWIDSPARMVQPLLLQKLGSSGLFEDVLTSPAPVDADLRLQTEILALRQVFKPDDPRASQEQLSIRFSLFDLKRRQLLENFILDIEEPATRADAIGGVAAANRAFARLLDELVGRLEKTLGSRPACTAKATRSAG